MRTLDEIAISTGADKASSHPVKGHGYCEHYDKAFGHLRNEQVKILEIGVGSGESIRMWLEGFPNAHIYGCDIVSGTNQWNTHCTVHQTPLEPRYSFLSGDQGAIVHWACYLTWSGTDFSIIVDDGGHYSGQIITTFECLWPHVVPGGYYAVEDLSAGMTVGTVFLTPGFPTHSQWLSTLQEKMHLGEGDIAEMHLSKELCIMRKRS